MIISNNFAEELTKMFSYFRVDNDIIENNYAEELSKTFDNNVAEHYICSSLHFYGGLCLWKRDPPKSFCYAPGLIVSTMRPDPCLVNDIMTRADSAGGSQD